MSSLTLIKNYEDCLCSKILRATERKFIAVNFFNQFAEINEKSKRHIFVKRALLLNQNQKPTAIHTRNIIFEFTEKSFVNRVDFNFVGGLCRLRPSTHCTNLKDVPYR